MLDSVAAAAAVAVGTAQRSMELTLSSSCSSSNSNISPVFVSICQFELALAPPPPPPNWHHHRQLALGRNEQQRIDNPNFLNLSLYCCCESGVRFSLIFVFLQYSYSIRFSSHQETLSLVCLSVWLLLLPLLSFFPFFLLWRPGNLYSKLHRLLTAGACFIIATTTTSSPSSTLVRPPPSIAAAAVNFTNKVAFNLRQHISLNCRLSKLH